MQINSALCKSKSKTTKQNKGVPQMSSALAKRLHDEANVGFVDAAVSGGPRGAERGTLCVMLGGEEQTIAKVSLFIKSPETLSKTNI